MGELLQSLSFNHTYRTKTRDRASQSGVLHGLYDFVNRFISFGNFLCQTLSR